MIYIDACMTYVRMHYVCLVRFNKISFLVLLASFVAVLYFYIRVRVWYKTLKRTGFIQLKYVKANSCAILTKQTCKPKKPRLSRQVIWTTADDNQRDIRFEKNQVKITHIFENDVNILSLIALVSAVIMAHCEKNRII